MVTLCWYKLNRCGRLAVHLGEDVGSLPVGQQVCKSTTRSLAIGPDEVRIIQCRQQKVGLFVFSSPFSHSPLMTLKKLILPLADLWRQSAQLNYLHYKSTYSRILFIAHDSKPIISIKKK